MAQKYRSSRSGSQRSGSPRGGSQRDGVSSRNSASSRSAGRARGGYGGPKKSNNGPTIAAVAIVVVVIVGLVVAFGSGDKSDKTTPDTNHRNPALKPTTFTPLEEVEPAGPTRLPAPELAPEAKELAKKLVSEAKELAAQGEVLYQEAVAAKKTGDDELWQSKLKEAATCYHEIMDAYNALLERMPTNNDWDEEQVANLYLGREAGQINKYISRLSQIRKQRRN